MFGRIMSNAQIVCAAFAVLTLLNLGMSLQKQNRKEIFIHLFVLSIQLFGALG
jgi:hypothetical protein